MQLGQSFGQGQPKPQAALAAIERSISLREWLKQPCQHLRGHADACVRNPNNRPFGRVVRGHRHAHAAAWPGELGRVLQKVGDHLRQPVLISVDEYGLGSGKMLDPHFVLCELGPMVSQRLPHQLVEIQSFALQCEFVVRNPGHVEQIIN